MEVAKKFESRINLPLVFECHSFEELEESLSFT